MHKAGEVGADIAGETQRKCKHTNLALQVTVSTQRVALQGDMYYLFQKAGMVTPGTSPCSSTSPSLSPSSPLPLQWTSGCESHNWAIRACCHWPSLIPVWPHWYQCGYIYASGKEIENQTPSPPGSRKVVYLKMPCKQWLENTSLSFF